MVPFRRNCPPLVVYLLPTEAITAVKENQNEVAVCFVAVPAAAIPVDVTVVATEDDVPSARCIPHTPSLHFIKSVYSSCTFQPLKTSLPTL